MMISHNSVIKKVNCPGCQGFVNKSKGSGLGM